MTITDADVRKFMTLSSVLCETQDVRVYAHGEKRFLQFRATGVPRSRPWQYNEAIIICEESFPNQQCGDTISVASSIPVASAARCKPCPCTPLPTPRWSTHGFGYVQVMFDSLTRHDVRCQSSTPPAGHRRFRLLQIGLGGGSFAAAANRQCNAIVDVIEKQEDVIGIAERFLGFSSASRGGGRLIHDDGLHGLRTLADSAYKYDAVAIDCMIQGVTPDGCKSPEFVSRIAGLLHPHGAVAQWAWGDDRALLRSAYLQHFTNVSSNVYGGIGGVVRVRGLKPRRRQW